MEVVQGSEFEVTLADLPGAGYEWSVADPPDGLTLVSVEAADPDPVPGRVGGSRPKSFRFRADDAGSYLLHVKLARAWEPASTPAGAEKTISVTVLPVR